MHKQVTKDLITFRLHKFDDCKLQVSNSVNLLVRLNFWSRCIYGVFCLVFYWDVLLHANAVLVTFLQPNPGSHYTAWSSMGTLINKGLVDRTSCPAKWVDDMCVQIYELNMGKMLWISSCMLYITVIIFMTLYNYLYSASANYVCFDW